MDLRNKIIQAINKGLNEALNLDDFSEDDLKILKKSLSSIIKDSNRRNGKGYYQELMNLIMSKDLIKDITKEDIEQCIKWYKEYDILYDPDLDGTMFKNFVLDIIYTCRDNKLNLNFIDTSNVTDMHYLFHKHPFNGDISEWDVSNVTNMSFMFFESKFNGDISKWDVSKVRDMASMFFESKFNGDISKWDVSKVRDMASMFALSEFNRDISKWNVSSVNDMNCMFCGNHKFNQNINNWNVSNVITMNGIFYDSSFNMPLNKWDVSSVTDIDEAFYKAVEFNQDISNWNLKSDIFIFQQLSNKLFYMCPIKEKYKPLVLLNKDLINESLDLDDFSEEDDLKIQKEIFRNYY